MLARVGSAMLALAENPYVWWYKRLDDPRLQLALIGMHAAGSELNRAYDLKLVKKWLCKLERELKEVPDLPAGAGALAARHGPAGKCREHVHMYGYRVYRLTSNLQCSRAGGLGMSELPESSLGDVTLPRRQARALIRCRK